MAAASGRFLGDGFHVRGDLAGFDGGHLPEIRARDFVELERKLMAFDPREPVGEMVDGVVGHRQRAVPAGVLHLELIVGVEFFARVHRNHGRLAVARVNAAAIGVEDEFGVDQIAMIPQQPFDAVGIAGFFVRGQREDNVAIRPVIFLA